MRVGAFELHEPLPELRNPHLLTVLRPWVDVGSVGTLALGTLESHFGASELGRLARPGEFYDYTRYRPTILRHGEAREVIVPNSILNWAKGTGSHDWLFLHLLEPHIKGEELMESVVEVMEHLGVRRYGLVGAMYGSSPHTRPLLASGTISDEAARTKLEQVGVRSSSYEGPTSIIAMATEEARRRGVEVLSLLVQLPPYARLDEDHKGHQALLRYLGTLYEWDVDLDSISETGDSQYAELDRATQVDRQMRGIVRRLEEAYDSDVINPSSGQVESADLPTVVEDFLRDLEEDENTQ